MGRLLRNVVLHVIALGMLTAALAAKDPFWRASGLVVAAGAFFTAWCAR